MALESGCLLDASLVRCPGMSHCCLRDLLNGPSLAGLSDAQHVLCPITPCIPPQKTHTFLSNHWTPLLRKYTFPLICLGLVRRHRPPVSGNVYDVAQNSTTPPMTVCVPLNAPILTQLPAEASRPSCWLAPPQLLLTALYDLHLLHMNFVCWAWIEFKYITLWYWSWVFYLALAEVIQPPSIQFKDHLREAPSIHTTAFIAFL